jgi:uncharacterized protein YcgI (DUF1989 family)
MSTRAPSQRIVVPAREGRHVHGAAEQSFRVVDVEGAQVGDLFAFAAEDLGEHIGASHTRARSTEARRAGCRPASHAGDSVTLRALADLAVVLSACPQDLVEINAGEPTPLTIELL